MNFGDEGTPFLCGDTSIQGSYGHWKVQFHRDYSNHLMLLWL